MFTLRLHSPVMLASTNPHFVMDLTPNPKYPDQEMRARGWRRSIRGVGGYWQGEFTLYGSINDLSKVFYEYLGYHLEERSSGHITWEGMLYEMELTTDGTTRRRTFDALYNHVRVRYRNTENKVQLTTAAEDLESQRVFGIRQQVWPVDGQDQAAAEAVRDSVLAEYGWPIGRTVGTMLGTVGGASLFIRACGYIYTANWQYENAGDNTTDQLSDWIILIVNTNCPFLKLGRVEDNATVIQKETRVDMRAWDVITKLLEGGNQSFKPARAWVDIGRRFHYETIDTTPVYFKRGGGFYTAAGSNIEASPWAVKPAVVRDLSYPSKKTNLNSWLTDARDWYMAEVDVWDNGDGTAKLVPKADEYSESDILSAQAAYAEQLRRAKEQRQRK